MAKVKIGNREVKPKKKKPAPKKVAPKKRRSTKKKQTTKKVTKKTNAKKTKEKVDARFKATEKGHNYSARKDTAKTANKAAKDYHFKDLVDVPPYSNYRKLDFSAINWDRRNACKEDPLLDLKTYMPHVFYLDWADYQIDLINVIEEKIKEGGKKAFGCPRGGGKTAITRGMIIRTIKYGMRKFAFFIGSREDKAVQTLNFIRTFWYRSPELQQDFPELAYPIYRIDGRSSAAAAAQVYKGERTHLHWGTKDVQFATMVFDEEDVVPYLENDPDCVIYLPDLGIDNPKYIINSSGSMIRVAGIDGSIRGEAEIHPVLLTQPRPDLVLMDDVQKDQKAESPKTCDDLERMIESAVDYLAAPDVSQAMLMPATVIRDGDVSDTYMNPLKKPEWDGERNGIIAQYPRGMDDYVIHDEVDGEENTCGNLWSEYKEIREQSYLQHGNLKLANEFYRDHHEEMTQGFKISWPQRFKSDSPNPDVNEVDAIQSAMNWRFKDLESFLSEGQNKPRSKTEQLGVTLRPDEVAQKMTQVPRAQLLEQWREVVAFIDVQDEILFYTVFAFDFDYNGQVIEYGTFPHVNNKYFRKGQVAGWSLLTKLYYKHYPEEKHRSGTVTASSSRAPFEHKIYHALGQCVDYLLSREYPIIGKKYTKQIRGLAIDTQWGKSSEVVKRFQREANNNKIITYSGMPFPPHHRQIEEYDIESGEAAGWLFEHQYHTHVKEPKWIVKTRQDGTTYILADVNRLKSFLMARFACPPGNKGSISLYQDSPQNHKMYAEHVAASEYPEPITARGLTKDCWQSKPSYRDDNDYLDTTAGCLCLASICGASLKTSKTPPKKHPSMKDAYKNRKVKNARH